MFPLHQQGIGVWWGFEPHLSLPQSDVLPATLLHTTMDRQERFELSLQTFGQFGRSYRLPGKMDLMTGLEPALNGLELRRPSI